MQSVYVYKIDRPYRRAPGLTSLGWQIRQILEYGAMYLRGPISAQKKEKWPDINTRIIVQERNTLRI